MNILEFIRIAFKSLGKNKVRSLLTMLGIIIGVGSVITMLAIGQGSKTSIENQIKSLGTNVIMVFPAATSRGGVTMGAGTSQQLEMSDVEAISREDQEVRYVSPVVRTVVQVIANNKNWSTQIQGVYSDYFNISNYEVDRGYAFTETQERQATNVCVIGQTVVDQLFQPYQDPLGQIIRIDRVLFKVTGILKKRGNNLFGQDMDDIILAPYKTVQQRLTANTYVPMIMISAVSENDIGAAVNEITKTLRQTMKVKSGEEDPFNIRTQQEIANIFGSTSKIMITLLAGIAAISLLVGGIGIMNIMLVTVTERTREIGLRMAVGSRNRDILVQFLFEAVLLSILGGIIGALLGIGAAVLLGKILSWPITVQAYSVVISFVFASLVGIFFGWYPARKASRLIPIDALRWE